MLEVLCVGAGGFVGAVARYLMGLVPYEGDFPLMTFLVNFLGAVFIGIIAETTSLTSLLSPNATLFLKTGVCGGFTTFSTFSLETLALFQEGNYLTGGAYAMGSLLACLAGVALGMSLTRAAVSLVRVLSVQGG